MTSSEQSNVSCGLWSNLRCKLELAADWSGKANGALWLAREVSASIHQMTEATRGAWLYNIASLSVPINPRETRPSLTPSHPALSLARGAHPSLWLVTTDWDVTARVSRPLKHLPGLIRIWITMNSEWGEILRLLIAYPQPDKCHILNKLVSPPGLGQTPGPSGL